MFKRKFKKLLSVVLAGAMAMTAVNIVPATGATQVQAAEDKGYEERLTPHMGWAPWNEFEIHTTGDIFIQQMDLMKEYGLVDAGYIYFTTEETWQMPRDKNGVLQVNTDKFPHGMKYYADYAHSLGMKAGIYSDVGEDTCVSGRAGSPGSGQGFGYYPYENSDEYMGNCLGVGLYGHDEQDLRMFMMDWGYDFIKVDWCGGRNKSWSIQGYGGDRYNEIGKVIEKLRQEKGQEILYNVCCWEFPGAKVVNGDCDSWRTGGDLWASWSSILQAIDKTKEIKDGKPVYEYSAPGKFNDLDMLQVGRGLTFEEDKSHFSMWCMASSPLSIGMDLAKITPETLSIFKNEEMIAIDQDPACVGASVAKTINSGNFNDGDNEPVEIWRKDLGEKGSQTKAIALFNRANKERTITVNWEELGFNGEVIVRDLWQHRYIDVEENHTVTIPAHGTIVYKVIGEEGTGNGSGNISTEKAELLQMELDIVDKPTEMNLTEMGNADWIYYGESNGTTFRRKANVDPQLEFTASFASGLNNDGYYNDSCTRYSWEDGTPQAEGNGISHGRTIGNTMGTFGQVDAASDSREHILYIPIAGWQSTNKIEVLVDGEVVATQELKPEQWTDTQQRVNKMVKVTYATDIPSEISVRWTVTEQINGRGTTGIEAAVLYVDPTQEAATIYASATDFLDTEVNLVDKGSLDYMQFGGTGGDIVLEKAGTDLLQKYTTGDNAAVNTADSTVTYKAENDTVKKGAVQSAMNSQFGVTLPAAAEMTEANIYLGVKDAEVTARAVTGTSIFEEKMVNIGSGSNKVLNVYYKSDTPVKVNLTLTGTMGSNPQMRLDAVTLAKNTGTIVLNPEVSQTDTNISVNTRTIRQGNSTEAKKVEVKLYDESGNVKTTQTADISSGMDTTTHMDVELVRDFVGKMEIKVLDASNSTIGKTFIYQLPMANINDSGLIGHYTAKKMVEEKNAVLVDVRSKEEFAESGIKGTLNIPLADIALKGEEALASVGVTKASTIIVYCASGRRSQQARQILQYMGYANTYDLRGYENWLYGATVNFTNYQEIILNNTPIYLTLEGIAYEEVELRYSVGKDSTIDDSKKYTGPITLDKSDRIKAYVLFEGKVVYESYDDYLVFVDQLPDFNALNQLEGVFCSDIDFIVEESHESYTPDRTVVTPTKEGIKYDKNSKGEEMKIKGHKFDKGVAAHAPSTVTYNIPEGMNRFVAVAGVDDTAGNRTNDYTVLFSIYIDGKLTDQVIRMTTGRFYTFDIAIPNGAKKLQLVAKKGNSSLHSGSNMFTEWGYARFMNDPDYKGNNPTSANLALNRPAIATGNQDGNHSALQAVDGKSDVSRWSTAQATNGGALPQAIQIDLGAVYELDNVSTYWFGDGREYTYSIYLTDKPAIELEDANDALKGGTLKEDIVPIVAQLKGTGYGVSGEGVQIAEKDIIRTNYNFLGRARGRYLTLNVTKSTGPDLAAIWEIEVYGTKVGESEEDLKELELRDPNVALTTAKNELAAAIKEAENCIEADYTEESWKVFKTALDEAKNPAEEKKEDVDALNQLKTTLQDAMNNLVTKASQLEKAKAELTEAVSVAESYKEKNYTPESWTEFAKALEEAKNPPENASEENLKTLTTNLQNAQLKLEPVNTEMKAAKEKLAAAVVNATETYNAGQKNYTDESWQAFAEAYNNAKNVSGDVTATEMDSLRNALIDTEGELKEKSEDSDTTVDINKPGDGDTTEDGNQPGDGDTTEDGDQPGDSDTTEDGNQPGDSDTTEDGNQPGDSDTTEDGNQSGDNGTTEDGNQPGDSDTTEDGNQSGDNGTAEDTNQSGDNGTADDTKQPGDTDTTEDGTATGDNTTTEDKGSSSTENSGDDRKPGTNETPATTEQQGSGNGNNLPVTTEQQSNTNGNNQQTTTEQTGKSPVVLTDKEAEIAKGLDLSDDVAKQIGAVADKYNVSTDTLLVTERFVTSLKNDDDVKGSSFASIQARAQKQTATSVKLKWNKVEGADGYQIFGNKCGKGNSYKLITTIKNGKKTSYTQKRLNKGTYYKYIVCAYNELQDGTKATLAVSKTIHTVTNGGKYGVAKKVKVNDASISLKANQTFQLKSTEVKTGKTIKKHRVVCYESSNSKIATVSKKGKITAKQKGKCNVYVYAQNGVYTKVTVIVK